MALSLVVDITAVIQGQSGQQFRTASSEVMCKGDGQSNDNSVALVPTGIYWKLQRILKPPNLNGSPTVKSPSFTLLFVPSFLPAQLKPFYPYTAPGFAVHVAQNTVRCSSTSPLHLCIGPWLWVLLKSNIMNWDTISKHPAWCFRSTQCTLRHNRFPTFLLQW